MSKCLNSRLPQNKIILNRDELCRLCHQSGKSIVFTNGCFDLLHTGHLATLFAAAQEGDILVVAVNTDDSVKRIKGESRPINKLKERMTMLAALECVDYVCPFDEDTPIELILQMRPDTIVKGGEYTTEQVIGHEYARVVTVPLVFGKSTTNTITEITSEN